MSKQPNAKRWFRLPWYWWMVVLGSLSEVIGTILLFFRINAELRHGNVGSSPHWVNPPYTDFEPFILHFPIRPRWFFFVGAALVFIGCVGVFMSKSRQ